MPRLKALQLYLGAFCLAALTDWSVKHLFPADGAYRHFAHRPGWLSVVLFVTLTGALMFFPRRALALGCGLALGGGISNLMQVYQLGYATNMIPVPLLDIFCNPADLFILTGAVLGIGSIIFDQWGSPADWGRRILSFAAGKS